MVKQIQVKQPAGVEDEVEYGEEDEKMEVVEKLLNKELVEEEGDDEEILDSTILDEIDTEENFNCNNNKKEVVELVSADEPKKKKQKKM